MEEVIKGDSIEKVGETGTMSSSQEEEVKDGSTPPPPILRPVVRLGISVQDGGRQHPSGRSLGAL